MILNEKYVRLNLTRPGCAVALCGMGHLANLFSPTNRRTKETIQNNNLMCPNELVNRKQIFGAREIGDTLLFSVTPVIILQFIKGDR